MWAVALQRAERPADSQEIVPDDEMDARSRRVALHPRAGHRRAQDAAAPPRRARYSSDRCCGTLGSTDSRRLRSAAAPAVTAAPGRAQAAPAPEPAPTAAIAAAPPAPATEVTALEKRVADLEAYVNNGAQGDAATTKFAGPGPGHNGWMMVCAALVLFMTLPGLALFYGGLVRQKNVLSVMAQCLGLAGLVALMWWAFGYSMAFSTGERLHGQHEVRVLERRRFEAEHRLRVLGLAERVLDVPADVRDHHPGPHRRRHRRAHEILGDHAVFGARGWWSSTSRSPTWSGASTAS